MFLIFYLTKKKIAFLTIMILFYMSRLVNGDYVTNLPKRLAKKYLLPIIKALNVMFASSAI